MDKKIAEIVKEIHIALNTFIDDYQVWREKDHHKNGEYDPTDYIAIRDKFDSAILALIEQEQAEREVWYRKEIARIEQVHEASKFLELSAKDRQMQPMVEALKAAKSYLESEHVQENVFRLGLLGAKDIKQALLIIDAILKVRQ